MEQLIFDSGIKEYQINGKGVLRFNPSDPNVYARFMDLVPKINEIEQQMNVKASKIDYNDKAVAGQEKLRIMRETDQRVKAVFNEVFGKENNFDEILEGVNLMAVASNGQRVVVNLMDALQPIMEEGAQACVRSEVDAAKLNREQRRAMQ
jgi:hypothetical protein